MPFENESKDSWDVERDRGRLEKKKKSVYLLTVTPGILKYCIFILVALKQQVVNVGKYSHKQLEGFIQAIFIIIS